MPGDAAATQSDPPPIAPPPSDAAMKARRLRPWYRRTWKRVALTLVVAAAVGTGAGWLYTADGRGDRGGADAASAGVSRSDLSGTGHSVTEYPQAKRGEPVQVSGTTLAGGPFAVETLRGDVVVLNVWGSWCAPCRAEAPILAQASRDYGAQAVSFVGINVRDNEAAAEAFEDRYRIPYPSIADFDGRTLLELNEYVPASAVPVTLILDRNGRVAARVLGELRKATLTALLTTVLAETQASSEPSAQSSTDPTSTPDSQDG